MVVGMVLAWLLAALPTGSLTFTQLLASASGHTPGHTNGYGQIHLWNVPGGSCQHLIRHQDAWVRALAFSPDDQLLISLGQWISGYYWVSPLPGTHS